MQGIRSSFGVQARVWLRTHDSGTRQREASSAASISSAPFSDAWDTDWTSGISRLMFSITYACTAVTVTAILAWQGQQTISASPAFGVVGADGRSAYYPNRFRSTLAFSKINLS